MSLPDSFTERPFMRDSENTKAQEYYEAQALKGPALDFEKIFQSLVRTEELRKPEFSQAREVVEDMCGIVDQGERPLGKVEALDILRILAKENKWFDYDDISFDKIRGELVKMGFRLHPPREAKDIAV